ncbi:MAG TPA: PQQ-binding-like beta-propeller repeat protein [Polyangia bacterium]|nr:PQQ-binding-like beta-propeller repeat protein [Polyangia bacterium]
MTTPIRPRSPRSLLWAAALLCASASSARANDWPTPGLDAAHTRLSAERSGSRFADGHWTFAPPVNARASASPVVANGFVVSADLDGTVNALAADTGQLVWQAKAGSGVQGTPAIAAGRVFVPTLGNKIVAFGLADGKPLWSADLGGMNMSSPAPIGGDLVVAAGFPQHVLVRLDGMTGAVVWRSPAVIAQFSNSAPAVSGTLVVLASNGGHVDAFDAATGAPRWSAKVDGLIHLATPVIAGGRVYVAGGDDSDQVHALDAATGTEIAGWPISLPAPAPDVAGTALARHRAVSSFAAAGGVLALETRLDDALDTDADGLADQFLSREMVVALDPATGAITWQASTGRAQVTDPNLVPTFFLCPTPAAFGTKGGGTPLFAVASSLAATVRILDAAAGGDLSDLTVAGRALASPVMANGRIITVAENGAVEGQLSSVNHPPAAPVLAASTYPLDSADITLRWLAATDPDAELPTYELRIDSDGEVLQSYAQQIFLGAGVTSTAVVGSFTPGTTYTYAVRAQDPSGAYSPWSAPETFTVVVSAPVTVDGTPAANLRAAVAAAQAGAVIALGVGTYPISGTLSPAAGVTLSGASGGKTVIDAHGLTVGIQITAAAGASRPPAIDNLAVVGADTCLSVASGTTGALLTHLVVHDCSAVGISVEAGASAAIANATVVAAGTGVDVTGSATIKNSLLTSNTVGLAVHTGGTLASSYDDLFGNQTDYSGLAAGTGDIATAVTFADLTGRNLLLVGPQPSTDKGDPSDDVGAEPMPNGGRINLGAFGGTAEAELSPLAPDAGAAAPDAGTAAPDAATTPPPGETGPQSGGCAVAGQSSGAAGAFAMLMALIVLGRRRRRA